MRVVSAWVLALALGCGSKEQPKRQDVPLTTTGSGSAQLAPEPDPQAQQPPDFPDGTQSLGLVRTVGVRLEPGDDAKRIGTVARSEERRVGNECRYRMAPNHDDKEQVLYARKHVSH